MTSLRRTALVWMTVLLTLVGLVGAAIAYSFDLTQANFLLDSQLRQIALNAGTGPSLHALSSLRYEPEDDILVQIWEPQNNRFYSSNPKIDIPRQAAPGFATVVAAGERWRTFLSTDGRTAVQSSQRISIRTELAQTAALEAAVPILVTIPLGWLIVGWGLQRVLGRLSTLAEQIAARGSETRQPIPVAEVPAEVAPLVVAMNTLIARLHKSIEQQKQFLSDAAHELRTPLAALRLQVENLQFQHRDAELGAALQEINAGANRASAVVDQLLRLAKYDVGPQAAELEQVDLVPLVLSCVADHIQIAEGKQVDLGMVSTDAARLAGTAKDLRILFSNLIGNAVRYTPAGGVIDIGVKARDGLVTVEIADTGCGIREDAMPRIFDRFFRAAPPDIEGTGLGLAICKAIATRHGLVVALRNRDGGGLIATVTGKTAA